jgi:hypothetical protein
MYEAKTWNDWIKFLQRFTPLKGLWSRIKYLRNGILVEANDDFLWSHPWTVRVEPDYNPDGTDFLRAVVKPGFVNGQDVWIDDYDAETQKSSWRRIIEENPPSLVLSYRDPARGAVKVDDDGIFVYGKGEGFPKFFDKFGIVQLTKDGTPIDDPTGDGAREIRASDIVLSVPRLSASSDVQVLDPATDAQTVVFSTKTDAAYLNSGIPPYVLKSVSKFQPPKAPDLADWLSGTAADPQVDEIRIATVWSVSPPGLGPLSVPDSSWESYTQYAVFWNLLHASKNSETPVANDPLTLRTGLAAGVGDALIAALLDQANDGYAVVSQFFAKTDYSGKFWSQ